MVRGAKTKRNCISCGKQIVVRQADVDRGWGKFCTKSCKAIGACAHLTEHILAHCIMDHLTKNVFGLDHSEIRVKQNISQYPSITISKRHYTYEAFSIHFYANHLKCFDTSGGDSVKDLQMQYADPALLQELVIWVDSAINPYLNTKYRRPW